MARTRRSDQQHKCDLFADAIGSIMGMRSLKLTRSQKNLLKSAGEAVARVGDLPFNLIQEMQSVLYEPSRLEKALTACEKFVNAKYVTGHIFVSAEESESDEGEDIDLNDTDDEDDDDEEEEDDDDDDEEEDAIGDQRTKRLRAAGPGEPFAGTGRSLRESQPVLIDAAAPAAKIEPLALVLNDALPKTTLQIRLPCGLRHSVTLNQAHTIGELRAHVATLLKEGTPFELQRYQFKINVADDGKTLADADLLNTLISVV